MGKAEKRELVSRLPVLLLHLLKWRVQPGMRGSSWQATVKVQRCDLERLLRDNPSLKSYLDEAMSDAYGDAIILAASETGLTEAALPSGLSLELRAGDGPRVLAGLSRVIRCI